MIGIYLLMRIREESLYAALIYSPTSNIFTFYMLEPTCEKGFKIKT